MSESAGATRVRLDLGSSLEELGSCFLSSGNISLLS